MFQLLSSYHFDHQWGLDTYGLVSDNVKFAYRIFKKENCYICHSKSMNLLKYTN